MITKLSQLKTSNFVRNVAVVASGTAVAQGITMSFMPIITRIYSPEVFGNQGLFLSIVGVLSTIAAMSYPIAIVLPRSDNDAIGIARLSLIIGIFMSLSMAIVLTWFGGELLSVFNAEAIANYIYLIPVAMFGSVITNVMGQWLIRKHAFVLTAKVSVLVSASLGSLKTCIGFFYPTALTLIVLHSLSGVFSGTLMFIGWKKKQSNLVDNSIPDDEVLLRIGKLAKIYQDFALYRTPQNFINAISHALPVIMLSTFFGVSTVGLYSIAVLVLGVPSVLIGNSVTQVFYPRITESIHKGENAKNLIVKATLALAAAGAVPFFIIIVAGPIIFSFVFGNPWHAAGIYAQWLSMYFFFQYINRPAVSAVPALGLQRGLLVYEIFSTGTKIAALCTGYYFFGSDVLAIALFSIVGVLAYVWLILWVISQSVKIDRSSFITMSET